MDIPRPDVAKKKKARRIIYTGAGFLTVLVITVALWRLEPAPPRVNRATVYVDTVRRGSMLRQVRGPGTLVPEEIRWISARTDGRIERRTLPGFKVEADTVLLEMSNPELEQAAGEAEFQLGGAEAEFADLKVAQATPESASGDREDPSGVNQARSGSGQEAAWRGIDRRSHRAAVLRTREGARHAGTSLNRNDSISPGSRPRSWRPGVPGSSSFGHSTSRLKL